MWLPPLSMQSCGYCLILSVSGVSTDKERKLDYRAAVYRQSKTKKLQPYASVDMLFQQILQMWIVIMLSQTQQLNSNIVKV